jgi:hypothetical protein
MIDSADRDENRYPEPWSFQINKLNNLQNGFFNRVGTTEVVLEWCEDNVSVEWDISGQDLSANQFNASGFIFGSYSAQGLIDALVSELNLPSSWTPGPPPFTFDVSGSGLEGGVNINCIGGTFAFNPVASGVTNIATLLGIDIGGPLSPFQNISCPDLRPYRYIDFVSPELTYPQNVKDASTAPIVRDVLCRWYFSDDVPEELDGYGFPILMGYTRFCRRRIYNPPKQIKWDNNLPVGNLSFQVYDENGSILPKANMKTNWLMTLQLSES